MRDEVRRLQRKVGLLYSHPSSFLLRLLLLFMLLWLLFFPAVTYAQTPLPSSDDTSIGRQPLTLELADGFKTKAEINFPRGGQTPFPAVLLLGGSGRVDMDGATPETPSFKAYKEMLDNLVRRGFVVYKYNKRGLDTAGRVVNQAASNARTNEQLVNDGVAALRQFLTDSRVDQNRVFLLGHSQGTMLAPQVASKFPGLVKGLLLCGTIADWSEAFDYQLVTRYINASNEADANKDGSLASEELTAVLNADQKVFENARRTALLNESALTAFQVFRNFNQPPRVGALQPGSNLDRDRDGKLSIEQELRPALTLQRRDLLTNRSILANSGESALALKSLLEGPRLRDVLLPLRVPVYFQHGAEDERAPLPPVREVARVLSEGGVATALQVYPGLAHSFNPADILLRLTKEQFAALPAVLPPAVPGDQSNWLLPRAQLPAPARPAPVQVQLIGGALFQPQPQPPGQAMGGFLVQLPAAGFGLTAPVRQNDWHWLVLGLLFISGGSVYLLHRLQPLPSLKYRSKSCKNNSNKLN